LPPYPAGGANSAPADPSWNKGNLLTREKEGTKRGKGKEIGDGMGRVGERKKVEQSLLCL